MLNNLLQMQLKLLEKGQLKKQKSCDLIGNKIVDTIIRLSRILPRNSSETVTNETKNIRIDRDKSPKIYLSALKRQQVFDDLRVIVQYNNGKSKNIELV